MWVHVPEENGVRVNVHDVVAQAGSTGHELEAVVVQQVVASCGRSEGVEEGSASADAGDAEAEEEEAEAAAAVDKESLSNACLSPNRPGAPWPWRLIPSL